jgi:hypothetical protein
MFGLFFLVAPFYYADWKLGSLQKGQSMQSVETDLGLLRSREVPERDRPAHTDQTLKSSLEGKNGKYIEYRLFFASFIVVYDPYNRIAIMIASGL